MPPGSRSTLTLRALTPRGLASVGICAAIAAGCGGGDQEPGAAQESRAEAGVRQARLASSLGQLNCADWESADEATRADIVIELEAFAASQVTGESASGTGPVLDNGQAIELFENRCGPRYARGFLLYKLYFHAAALAGSG